MNSESAHSGRARALTQGVRRIAKALLPEAAVTLFRVRRALRGSTDAEARLLPVLARDGAFLDVGANLGSWSGTAARVFRRVYAFEPNAGLAAALRTLAPPNLVVHEVALSDRDGAGRFAVPIYGRRPLNTRGSLEPDANPGFEKELVCGVRLSRLDSLDLGNIDVIKVDVEGHEGPVLAGARTTLERERPTLIIEIEERHHAGQ
jgi:FkbM family methyltransferase